jgi:hypothetical protein
MSVGKEAGEFSFTSSGVTITSEPGGSVTQAVNLEGTATAFGTVLGTLTFHVSEPGADSGFTTWAGTAYKDDGEAVGGIGRGVFEKSGTNKWRVRAVLQVTGGPLLLSDGEIALEGRSYAGKLYEWE